VGIRSRIVRLALALAVVSPAPAVAQPPSAMNSHAVGEGGLLLAPGERVTLRLGPGGRVTVLSITLADPADIAPPKDAPEAAPLGRSALVKAPPGTISLVYGYFGSDTLLRVENATARGLDYAAALLVGDEPSAGGEPTSVCTVRSGLASFEFWGGRRVPALLLTRFTARPTNDAVCSRPPPRPEATST
jgi:hypothetical protein